MRVVNVRASDNGEGIYLHGFDNLVKDCIVTANSERGIYVHQGQVVGNNIGANGSEGISASFSSLLVGNMLSGNQTGITVLSFNLVRGNILESNGTNGVLVQLDQNSIEENFVSRHKNGIKFETSGNYFRGNSAPGNTTAFHLGGTDQRDGGGNWDGTVP